MGIVDFLRRIFFGAPTVADQNGQPVPTTTSPAAAMPRVRPRLKRLRFQRQSVRTPAAKERADACPYQFASPHVAGGFLNLSTDANPESLRAAGLPVLVTPADIAQWLGMPLGQVAWLAGRFY